MWKTLIDNVSVSPTVGLYQISQDDLVTGLLLVSVASSSYSDKRHLPHVGIDNGIATSISLVFYGYKDQRFSFITRDELYRPMDTLVHSFIHESCLEYSSH